MNDEKEARDLDLVLRALEGYPKGASIQELMNALSGSFTLRTLQRRLAYFSAQGHLTMTGAARSRRYQIAPEQKALKMPSGADILEPSEASVRITTEAQAIQRVVRAPIQTRDPVSYRREFLDQYRPNESFYLSPEIRIRLAALGKFSGGDRPAGTFAREILNRLLIDLSWNSSRLEGNTYSLLETERLVQFGQEAAGKNAVDAVMILNHKAAIEMLVEQSESIGFNRYTVCNLHSLLSNNLLGNPQACGRLRYQPVGIKGSAYVPLSVPQLIDECFQQVLDTAAAISDPFEQAFFAMVQLPYLQPFDDVNKRVSRLAANIPLVQKNFCPLSFVDVPERMYVDGLLGVYELNKVDLLRDVFVWAYERSCKQYSTVRKSLGEPDPFRLQYRLEIYDVVWRTVRQGMNKEAALSYRRERAMGIARVEDRAQFEQVVETELEALHEGNIARYRLRPSEYEAWRKIW